VTSHSPPLDGTVTANGRALVPFTLPPGPVSAWPQQQDDPGRWRRAVTSHRGWLAAVPIVLVNAVATGAQLGVWRAHLPALAEAVLVALALESIAVYLAWQAHLAQLADDSALRLRMAAYGFALVIGALNYSHFMAPGWRPTVAAVTFGLMSAVSPWLWSVHSRRVSRDALKDKGLIESHAVRLGATRWLLHAYRSFRVMHRATWAGETDPGRAIATVYPPASATSGATAGDRGDKPSPAKDTLSVEAEAARDNVSPGAVRKRRERARKAADRSRA
jgi:hypothetical protein